MGSRALGEGASQSTRHLRNPGARPSGGRWALLPQVSHMLEQSLSLTLVCELTLTSSGIPLKWPVDADRHPRPGRCVLDPRLEVLLLREMLSNAPETEPIETYPAHAPDSKKINAMLGLQCNAEPGELKGKKVASKLPTRRQCCTH